MGFKPVFPSQLWLLRPTNQLGVWVSLVGACKNAGILTFLRRFNISTLISYQIKNDFRRSTISEVAEMEQVADSKISVHEEQVHGNICCWIGTEI